MHHECAGLHGKETIHDEHLKEADKEADGPEVKPKDGQDLGDDSETDHCVQRREQAEQVVHGLMQRGLQPDRDQMLAPRARSKRKLRGRDSQSCQLGDLTNSSEGSLKLSGDAALVCCHILSYSSAASFLVGAIILG